MSDQSPSTGQDNGSGGGGGGGGRFRNWTAILDLAPGPDKPRPRLAVRGEYRLGMRSGGRRLALKVPADFNPRFLAVDVVDAPGNGGDWIPLEAEFDAKAGQYDQVVLRDGGGEAHNVAVEEAH